MEIYTLCSIVFRLRRRWETTYTCAREDDDVLRLTEQLRHVLQRVILRQLVPLNQFPRDTNLQKTVIRGIISTLQKFWLSPQSKKKTPEKVSSVNPQYFFLGRATKIEEVEEDMINRTQDGPRE